MALAGFGTLLKIGDGGGTEVFTTIAEITDLNIKFAAQSKTVTSHSSTGAWEERIMTFLNFQVTGTLNFTPTAATQSQSTGALKDFKNRTKRNFQIVWPDGGATTWPFSGFFSTFDMKAPVGDVLSAAFTIDGTGAPTLAG